MASGEAMKGTLARVTLPPRPKEALQPSGSGIRVTIYQVVTVVKMESDAVSCCCSGKKPPCSTDTPHRRSCSNGCRRYRHGSAYGTKSSDLRACRALLGYLVLPGTIRLAFHSGIHPHLAQRRGDAFPLPSPVGAVADGCGMPATSSALALGAAHARGSAASQ